MRFYDLTYYKWICTYRIDYDAIRSRKSYSNTKRSYYENAETITHSLLEKDECGLGFTADNYSKEELQLLFTGLKIMHARTGVLDRLKYIILPGSNMSSAEKRALVEDLFAYQQTAHYKRYAPGEFKLNKIGGLTTVDDARVGA
jgi:hypothetical protein